MENERNRVRQRFKTPKDIFERERSHNVHLFKELFNSLQRNNSPAMRRDEEGRTVLDVAEDFEDLDLPLGLLLVLVDVRQHLKEGRNRHYRGENFASNKKTTFSLSDSKELKSKSMRSYRKRKRSSEPVCRGQQVH